MTAASRCCRGLVPAVPEPLGRRPRVRRRRRALRQRRRRRELQLRRLRPGRRPRATRAAIRPARPGGADPADRRGRRAALPGRPHDRRPDGARRRRPARRPGHRRGAARQPGRSARRRERAPDRRVRLAQPVPVHRAPGHERALGRRRRLEHVGGDQPHPHADATASRNFGWPCYEGACRQAAYDSAQPEPLRVAVRRRPATVVARCCTYRHSAKVVAGRRLPHGRLVDHRPRVLRRRRLPGRVQRRAVLRRLLAQLHLGDAPGRGRRCRTRRRCRRSSTGAAGVGRPAVRPGRRPLLRRPRRRHDPADRATRNHRPTARATATPDQRAGAARPWSSTARRRPIPTGTR